MNFKTTVILFVVLVVVGGYVFFTSDRDTKRKKAEEHKLVDIPAAADVTRLAITDAAGKKTVLERAGKDWRLVEPLNAPAEARDVTDLIDALISMKSNNQLDPKEAAASKIGLEKPQSTVELTAGEKTTQVQFGDRLSVGDGVYARITGKNEIEIVPASVLDKIDRPATAFRQLKLIDTPSNDIKQVTITRKDATLKLQKTANDWAMTEPAKMPLEPSEMTDLLGQISRLKAVAFVDNAVEAADAMKSVVLSISYSTQPPTTQPAAQAASQPALTTIEFGDYDYLKKFVYVRLAGSPVVARVNASVIEAFQKQPIELRDKRALDIIPDEVNRFSITTVPTASTKPSTGPVAAPGHMQVVVQRRRDGVGVPFLSTTKPALQGPAAKLNLDGVLPKRSTWVLGEAPKNSPADESEVNSFLTALHPLRVEKYLATLPATQPAKSYDVTVHTEAPGGAKSAEHVIHLIDQGTTQPYLGSYESLNFEIARTTMSQFLESKFGPKPPSAPIPAGGPTKINPDLQP
jgi:hypothetical protein